MSRRKKKVSRKPGRTAGLARIVEAQELESRVRATRKTFARLCEALDSVDITPAVQAALDDFDDAFAHFNEAFGEAVETKSTFEAGFHPEQRHVAPDPSTMSLEELQQADEEEAQRLELQGKGYSRGRSSRPGRHSRDQVPVGFAIAEGEDGLLMGPKPQPPWILGPELHQCALQLLLRIADTINSDLAGQVAIAAFGQRPERNSLGDGKQVAKWLSDSFLQLEAIDGNAVRDRDGRKIHRLTEMQAQLVRQLEGLVIRGEHERIAEAVKKPTADLEVAVKDHLANLDPELADSLKTRMRASELQPTAERVVEHLREHFAGEVPEWLTPSVVRQMAKQVSLNQGSKGKQSAERVVLDAFTTHG